MGVSVILYLALLAAVGAARLFELRISAGRERRLAERGIARVPDPAFRGMVAFHAAVPIAAALEVVALRRPLLPALALPMLVVFGLASGLRWWVVRSLGEHWNVRVMASSRLGVVVNGPYRFVRHPNYAAVFVEMTALPLIHAAWLTALLGTPIHALLLRRRIAVEEAALFADPWYGAAMGDKPRFLPRIGDFAPRRRRPVIDKA